MLDYPIVLFNGGQSNSLGSVGAAAMSEYIRAGYSVPILSPSSYSGKELGQWVSGTTPATYARFNYYLADIDDGAAGSIGVLRKRVNEEISGGDYQLVCHWMQGEDDSETAAESAIYGEKLLQMISYIQEDFADAQRVSFVAAKIAYTAALGQPRDTYIKTVNAGIEAAMATSEYFHVVETSDLPRDGDGVHLTAAVGQEQLGRRMAKRLLGLPHSLGDL